MSTLKVDAVEAKSAGGDITLTSAVSGTVAKYKISDVVAGDIVYGTGAGTVGILNKGTAGQQLQINSGATAPEWAALSVDSAELVSGSVDIAHMSATGTTDATTYLRGDNTWAVVAGDIEGVTASTGLSGGGTSGTVSISLDTTNAQEWTGTQNFNSTSLTFDATQDWDLSLNQVCDLTLTANTTFDAPTNLVDGGFYSITIIQDGTGSRTASWNTVFKWAGGTAPTLTTTGSAKDIFVFRSDGTNMLEVGRQLNVS